MNRFLSLLLIVYLFSFCARNGLPDLTPVQLRCNNLENPSGTEGSPVFNWMFASSARGAAQTAYQIILDPDPINLKSEIDCYWNSGKISSSQSAWIRYSGPGLNPGTRYYWKVKLWDNNDNPSGWSQAAFFITGLFEKADWSGAKWIGYEEIPDSLLLVPGVHGNGDNLGDIAKKRTVIPYFRKEFSLDKKISQVIVFVSGLGHYELHVNGEKVGDRFLSPGWTNYQKTCYYNTYDITENLKRGKNAIGSVVGNGFYNINRERYRKLLIAWGAPKMILKIIIRYNDGSEEAIVSDNTWKTTPSPITFTSIYGGEDYDARLEQPGWDKVGYNDQKWNTPLTVRDPMGELKPEADYPLKIMQVFDSVSITSKSDSIYVYDFGQNASGIIKLMVHGEKGQVVRLVPGELLDDDSLVTQKASGGPFYFSYTLKGDDKEIWMPRFSYYGFRYIQANGAVPSGEPNPDNLPVITGLQLLHTRNSSPAAGNFRCSSELFNSIHELINWSIKSNLSSVATDCPHREKLGWLEQTHLMGNSIRYIYDIHNLYDKIIDDMTGAQLENGLVPDIAPEFVPFIGGFRDSPEWGSACIILPWDIYEWYGDIDAVKKAYPMMKRYLSYLESVSENNILSHGLGDWYDLGPKFPGEAQLTPKAVTATSIYYYDAKLLTDMATLIGENDDALSFRNLADKIGYAFNKEFLNPETKVYSTGSQTAYAMPLFFGMVDDTIRKEVVENLVRSINKNNKALTAGDIGYRYLIRVLEQEGYSQLIYEMNSKTDVPGYGYQLAKGATSLTESWAGLRDVSNNHMMLGHLMEWFYSGLGGIHQLPGSKGYEHILIAPDIVGDITWAEATCQTIHGEISSSWNISGTNLTMKVRIPANCTATVEIPFSDPDRITESGIPLRSSESASNVEAKDGRTSCEILSGDYIFVCTF
jgi:alpha-L-rhamnosidase